MKRFIILFLVFSSFLFSEEKHEIEVLAEKIPFSFDLKKGILVVEKEFLKLFPALNLPQLISYVANMNFVCRGIFQADPQIMSFNQEQVVVMVNGIPMNNSQTGHHNFSLPLDVEHIERIEILRGGLSSLCGFSGAGGIINIVTSNQNNFKISHSSFNTFNSSLSLCSKNFSISSGIVSTDGYMKGIDGKKYYLQGGVRLPFRKSYIDIWGGWVLSRFGAANFYASYPSFEKLGRLFGVICWNNQIASNAIFNFKISSQYSRDEFKLFRDNPNIYLNGHKTLQNSIEMGVKKVSKRGAYYVGISSYLDSISSDGIREGEKTKALGNHTRRLFSLFGEASWETGEFFMNSGLRFATGAYSDFNSHILLGLWIRERVKISNSFHRSFRIPTYTELYYKDPVHISTSSLRPETNLGYTLSFDYKIDKNELGARFFINRSNNLIDWRMEQEQNVWISENLKKGKYYGVDLSLSHRSNKTALKLLYTLQKVEFEDDPLLKSLKYHYYFPESSLSFMASSNFRLLSLSGALKMEREKSTKEYRFYLNIKASKRLGEARLFFEILNLFNTRVEKIPGLPEPPRSYSAGLNFDF